MRLKASLCSEIESKLELEQEGGAGEYQISSASYVAYIESDGNFVLDIDGAKLYINADKNTISFEDNSVALTAKGTHNVMLIVDRMSVEILADDGLVFTCIKNLCGSNSRRLSVAGKSPEVRILKC